MKMNKKLVAILLLVVMVVSLAACSSNSIVGVWKLDAKAIMEMTGMPAEMVAVADMIDGTMEFTKDGKTITKITAMGQTQTIENTYKVDGNKLISDGGEATFKIDGDKLSITESGLTLTRTRAK